MIEHESHSHGHHSGLPWLDLILAGSTIFISSVSLIVSIHHGHTMEKLVAANEKQVEAATLPILRFTTGNILENSKTIHFDLRNGGTGPAIIEWLRVKWNDQPTTGFEGFARSLLSQPNATDFFGLSKYRIRHDPSSRAGGEHLPNSCC